MTSEKTPLFNNQSNYQNLIARLFTAFIALSILLGVLYFFGLNGAMALVLLISTFISIELVNLFFSSEINTDKYFKFALPILIFISLLATFFLSKTSTLFPIVTSSNGIIPGPTYILLPIYTGLVLLPWIYRLQPAQIIFDKLVVYLLVSFYCYILPINIFEIFKLDTHFYYFGLFALLVFGTDTLAYFFGKLFGKKFFKQSFQPNISPSKTFEGFVGSLLWPIILIGICYSFNIFQFSFDGIVYLYFTTFAAISGDLMASLIKRKSLKKDSGSIFVGHGGFLDRLDSMLLSAPIFLMACPFIHLV